MSGQLHRDAFGHSSAHQVAHRGPREIRPTSAAFLRDSVATPNKDVNFNYLTANVTTTGGEKIRGIFLNEDDYSIQLRDMKGNPRSFLKRDLRDFAHEKESVMPAFPALSAADLNNLVAYLSSLKGAR